VDIYLHSGNEIGNQSIYQKLIFYEAILKVQSCNNETKFCLYCRVNLPVLSKISNQINQIKFILAIKKNNNITQKERINKHYTWQGSPIETIRLINFGLP
jgi:hypothetical protein